MQCKAYVHIHSFTDSLQKRRRKNRKKCVVKAVAPSLVLCVFMRKVYIFRAAAGAL